LIRGHGGFRNALPVSPLFGNLYCLAFQLVDGTVQSREQVGILAMPDQRMMVKIHIHFHAMQMALHGDSHMRLLLANAIAALAIKQPGDFAELFFNLLDLRWSEVNVSACVGDFHEFEI